MRLTGSYSHGGVGGHVHLSIFGEREYVDVVEKGGLMYLWMTSLDVDDEVPLSLVSSV